MKDMQPLYSFETRKKWEKTTGKYFEAADITNERINFPALLRGLGSIEGLTVLDYGCGNGRFTKRLEKSGAARVIGVDISETMIDLAKKNNSDSRIEYCKNSNNTLAFLKDNSIDKVLSNLVFMMSPSKKDMQQSLKEIHRVLKDDGTFVFLVTHSAFIERGAHDYRNEFKTQFDYFEEEKPYKFKLMDKKGKEIDEDFYDYHYTLSTYINSTIKAGFSITGTEEISYPCDVAKEFKISPHFQKFPQSLLVISKKRI